MTLAGFLPRESITSPLKSDIFAPLVPIWVLLLAPALHLRVDPLLDLTRRCGTLTIP